MTHPHLEGRPEFVVVPRASLHALLMLIDPPVTEVGGVAYKFVNPMAADVLHALSNGVRKIASEAKALAALPGGGVACLWTYDEDDYSWDSACGEKYCFTEGGPADNGHKFCHGCGNPLALTPTPNPHEADQP